MTRAAMAAARVLLPCAGCGCPYEAHRHNHGRAYCGRHPGCNRYRPQRAWWQIWRTP